MKCEKCGKELVEGALYCTECGNKVKKIEKIICPKCGEEFEEETNFCPKCGYKFCEYSEENKKSKEFPPIDEYDIYVSRNKRADYFSIGEAIKNANAGDIIYIDSGVYEETICVENSLKLIGNENNKPIIVQSEDFEYSGHYIGENALVKNIIFETKDRDCLNKGAPIVRIMANGLFENCDFRKNYFKGIFVASYDDNEIEKKDIEVTFYNCSFSDNNDTVFTIVKSATVNIVNCIFFNNKNNIIINDKAHVYIDKCDIKNSDNGISVYNDSYVVISNTTISNLKEDGIYAMDTAHVTIIHSDISYCENLCFISDKAEGKLISCKLSNYKEDAVASFKEDSGYSCKQGYISVIHCEVSNGKKEGIFIPNGAKGMVINCYFSNIDEKDCILASDDSFICGNKRD